MATAWDPGDGESLFTRRSQRRKRTALTFAYDVAVNVLANLIAGGIGVIALQLTGVIDLDSRVVRLSAIFVIGATILMIAAVAELISQSTPSAHVRKRMTRINYIFIGVWLLFALGIFIWFWPS